MQETCPLYQHLILGTRVKNVLSRKVKMSMFNNWLKLFIYNFYKMEERFGNLQKGLYTNFSKCLSFAILLRKKKGIRN